MSHTGRDSDEKTVPNSIKHMQACVCNFIGSFALPYPSSDCKHDIQESEDNMLNPIFKENVQGRIYPGSWAIAEP